VFADPAPARAGDLDAFLALLNDNLAVRSERRGNEIVSSTTTL
jgi:hypothetical protein